MGDLKEDFKYNESMKEKIEEMTGEYSGYRPIRGDGNCYYRAVSFSFLEVTRREDEKRRGEEERR